MRDGRWKYTIRAYYPTNSITDPGGLAIETMHSTEASRDVEILAFRDRMKRGQIACIDVISHVEPFGTTRIYSDKVMAGR